MVKLTRKKAGLAAFNHDAVQEALRILDDTIRGKRSTQRRASKGGKKGVTKARKCIDGGQSKSGQIAASKRRAHR